VDENIEYTAMYLLFHVRDNRKAIDRMFWLREKNGLPLTDKMQRLKDDMIHIRNIKKYLLYKDYENAEKELEWALEHYPDSREVAIYQLSYLTETAATREDLEHVRTLALEFTDHYGESMYFKKAIGDVYFKSGETDKALAIYAELKETSNDGMLLLDIRKKEEQAAG
jgi:tetratricopeptide (TPR) repeat protein